jgi:hypothetical protein
MDIDMYFLHQMAVEMEDDEEPNWDIAAAAAAVIFVGAEKACILRAEHRQQIRLYFCWPSCSKGGPYMYPTNRRP